MAVCRHGSEMSLYRVSLVLYVASSSYGYECGGVLHGIEKLCLIVVITGIPLLRPLRTYSEKNTGQENELSLFSQCNIYTV